MALAVVGQGAIASLFCYYFRSQNPVVLTRDGADKQVSLTLLNKQVYTFEYKIDSITSPKTTSLEYLLICVKSYHIKALINDIKQWLEPSTTLVLVQNGMGGSDLLRDTFNKNILLTGTTTDAVYQLEQGKYLVTAKGQLDIGRFDTSKCGKTFSLQSQDLALLNHHPQLKVHDNIRIPLLQKLAVNAVINPLTAVLNIKNGELRRYPRQVADLKADVNRVFEQIARNTSLQNAPELQSNQINGLIDKVIENTANNFSSMHQDVQNNRLTEIDAVLGYLLEQAGQYQLYVPHIDMLYDEVLSKADK